MLQKKKVHTEDTTSHGENKTTTYVTSTCTATSTRRRENTHSDFFFGTYQLETRFARIKKNTNRVTLNQPYGVKVRRENLLPTGGTHMHRGLCQTTKSVSIHHVFPEIRNKRTKSYYKRWAHCGHFHTAHQNAKRLLDGHPALRLVAVSYTHLRAHETRGNLVCRLLLEKKK